MLGSDMVPAFLFFIFLLFVPESPRWLIKVNNVEDAKVILARINGMQEARVELNDIKNTISEEKGGYKQLVAPGIRIALIKKAILIWSGY